MQLNSAITRIAGCRADPVSVPAELTVTLPPLDVIAPCEMLALAVVVIEITTAYFALIRLEN